MSHGRDGEQKTERLGRNLHKCIQLLITRRAAPHGQVQASRDGGGMIT